MGNPNVEPAEVSHLARQKDDVFLFLLATLLGVLHSAELEKISLSTVCIMYVAL